MALTEGMSEGGGGSSNTMSEEFLEEVVAELTPVERGTMMETMNKVKQVMVKKRAENYYALETES